MTIRKIQKERPRTFETSATAGNLERTKTLLIEAGAIVNRTLRMKAGGVRIYLTWPADEP